MIKRIFFIFCIWVLCVTALAGADIIHLKNGGTFEGRVVSDEGEEVVFEAFGGRFTFNKDEISSIEKTEEKTPPLEAVSKEDAKKELSQALSEVFKQGLKEAAQEQEKEEQKFAALSPQEQWAKMRAELKKMGPGGVLAVFGIMVFVLLLVFFVSGLFLFFSIKIVDSGNERNGVMRAFLWSILTCVSSFIIPPFGILISLLLIGVILMSYYKLSVGKLILAIIIDIAIWVGSIFLVVFGVKFILQKLAGG